VAQMEEEIFGKNKRFGDVGSDAQQLDSEISQNQRRLILHEHVGLGESKSNNMQEAPQVK